MRWTKTRDKMTLPCRLRTLTSFGDGDMIGPMNVSDLQDKKRVLTQLKFFLVNELDNRPRKRPISPSSGAQQAFTGIINHEFHEVI